MTLPQVLSFGIIGGMLGLFLWARIRHDLVAVFALIAAVLCRVVPAEQAFAGFGNPVIIIVGSGVGAEPRDSRLGRRRGSDAPLPRLWQQVGVLTGSVAALPAFMKKVGAAYASGRPPHPARRALIVPVPDATT